MSYSPTDTKGGFGTYKAQRKERGFMPMAFTLYQHIKIAACPIDGIVQQYKNFIYIINTFYSLYTNFYL